MENQDRWSKIIKIALLVALVALGFCVFDRYWGKESQNSVGDGWITYDARDNSNYGFSIRFPDYYKIDNDYQYQGLIPNKEVLDGMIYGVSFPVFWLEYQHTNLSLDSHLSVEVLPGVACAADQFLYSPRNQKTMTENGVVYSYAETIEPAAGNLYEEHVYAVIGSEPCTAVRYFIHSGNIGNYEPGTVQEFDRAKLLAEFDAIRATLILKK